MGDVCVRTVAIQCALFWVSCSFWVCVSVVSSWHAGWVYMSMGLMYCLYTRVMCSLDWSNVVLASAWRTLRRVLALVLMLSVCVMTFPMSYVAPCVVAVLMYVMGVFSSVIVGCVLYLRDQGMIRVSVDFDEETLILFERSHCSSMLLHSCKWEAAM